MEEDAVFEETHALLFELIEEGIVNALRLDHTDGLYDPSAYFEKLQGRFRPSQPEPRSPDDQARPLPILAEKILQRDEALPQEWSIDGTTGYEFGVSVRGLWLDPAAEARLTRIYTSQTGDARSFAEHVYECKRHVVGFVLIGELNVLSQAAHRIAMEDRHFRDFTLLGLTRALTEIVCAFPVYRTYLRPENSTNSSAERVVRAAVRLARMRSSAQDPSVFAFFENLLLARLGGSEAQKFRQVAFALRFQQLTGPIMAKAVEDTAFYRYTRMMALNEVGGSPARFGTSVRDFHRENAERARSWPLSMTSTATHDTKRGEDVAARIAVLSEVPELWERALLGWGDVAASARRLVDERAVPEPALEYSFYQTLVGVWPFGGADQPQLAELEQRLSDYLLKSAREAKTATSWLNRNAEYESALGEFVRRMFRSRAFIQSVAQFCATIEDTAVVNALGQALLRFCSPGVPDTYQGSELWHQVLVDPDNRRPVDFERRRRFLHELTSQRESTRELVSRLLESASDGHVKQYVVHVALELRRAKPELFTQGDYLALDGGEHVVAFQRVLEHERLLCVVPRLTHQLRGDARFPIGPVWGARTLEGCVPGKYRNLFSGVVSSLDNAPPVAELLADFPLGLWLREAE
jgi:(1->4)-alpha-D-glucan 1-alpha-D-glucosylmutase